MGLMYQSDVLRVDIQTLILPRASQLTSLTSLYSFDIVQHQFDTTVKHLDGAVLSK